MRLAEIARQPLFLGMHLVRPEAELTAVQADSRRVDGRTGFYALQGLRTDGHAFLAQAAAAGAPALFVGDPVRFEALRAAPPPGVAGVFLVPPGRAALARVAALVHGAPSRRLALLGVTGTNGKTTVSHLVAHVWEALGQPCGLIGSLGMHCGEAHRSSDRTTPEAPDIEAFLGHCLELGATAAAMEVSSIGIALERTAALHFCAAAFTNLTPEHLDFHGSLDDYAAAKFRLFLEQAPPHAVVNLDDPRGPALLARLAAERPAVVRTGFSTAAGAAATLTAEAVRAGPDGMRGVLRHGSARAPFATPLVGRFNLSNLLAATGLLRAAGAELADVAAALPRAGGAPGRFERVPTGRDFLAVVDYAHTPDALENVLRCARELTRGRVLVVFGCGGERDRVKRPLMGAIAEWLADEVVLTSDNPRGEPPEAILAEIAAGMRGAAQTIPERRAAIRHALERARPGDCVLVAGKGHETYQEVAGQRLPFDDRQVVRDWAGV